MNIIEAFADFLESSFPPALGQTIHIGGAPSSNKVPDALWWVEGRGGSVTRTNATGERTKEKIIEIYCRNRDYEAVYDDTQALETLLNCAPCVELEGYEVLDIVAESMFVDDDIDREDRKLGLVVATLTVSEDCNVGVS